VSNDIANDQALPSRQGEHSAFLYASIENSYFNNVTLLMLQVSMDIANDQALPSHQDELQTNFIASIEYSSSCTQPKVSTQPYLMPAKDRAVQPLSSARSPILLWPLLVKNRGGKNQKKEISVARL
jgi:hypothetical protein